MSANDEAIGGVVAEDLVVPAGGSWSRIIKKGQVLRIIDLKGKQAVDFLCYNADDHEDRYAAADTMKINDTGIFLSLGTVLYSVGLTPLFTIVRDTCGRHDTIGGCCSAALNTFRYRVGYQANCRDNFLTELRKYGMGPRDLAANVNFFMYVPVGDNGEMDMGPGFSKAGDFVDLRAETEVLAVISNCPQINNPVNDFNPTPIRVVTYDPHQAGT
jgi:urea carboxylase-associated protein 1